MPEDAPLTTAFIEGFPGTGKSTLAQWIFLQRGGSRRTRWYYEYAANHPVCDTRPDAAQYFTTWQDYQASLVSRWKAYLEKGIPTGDEVIFDGALIQNVLLVALRHMVAPDAVSDVLCSLAGHLRQESSRLIYLAQPDPREAYAAMCARRGPHYTATVVERFERSPYARARDLSGLDGLLSYWQHHDAVVRQIIAKLPLGCLTVDGGMTHPTARNDVARFLGWTPVEQRPDPSALSHFAGHYRSEWRVDPPRDWTRIFGNGSKECTVLFEANELYVDGLLWPHNRLIPNSPGRFNAEAWPLALALNLTPDGGRSLIIYDDAGDTGNGESARTGHHNDTTGATRHIAPA